jgi:hypothetical protein
MLAPSRPFKKDQFEGAVSAVFACTKAEKVSLSFVLMYVGLILIGWPSPPQVRTLLLRASCR